MPKLDLRRARRIKAQGGEVSRLKGDGFSWTRPDPLDFIAYGQSNTIFWAETGDGVQDAHPDTLIWDRGTSQWVAPGGRGVIEFLNAMQAATGRVCRMVYGGASGVAIAALQKGAGLYETLLTDIQNSGATPSFVIWHQGEGDAAGSAANLATYQASLDTLHGSLTTDLGLTRTTLPIVLSSLATTTSPSIENDANWDAMQRNLATINASYPHVHFSHSNVPAERVDSFHWTPASYGKSGRLSAQRVQVLMGLQSASPNWTIDQIGERVSGTQTRVNVTHSLGDDFTPTSGITGFEVTGNQGGTQEAAIGEREDATTILLTHADIGTAERRVRYHYGRTPDITNPVLDNSALAVPLQFTTDDIVIAGAAALPTPTHAGTYLVAPANPSVRTGIPVSGETEELLVPICVFLNGTFSGIDGALTVTAQPSGTQIVAGAPHSTIQSTGGRPSQLWTDVIVPVGTTSIDLSLADANTFIATGYAIWTCPTANLNSTTPVDAQSAGGNAAALTIGLATSAGGFALVLGQSRSVGNTAGIGVWSGDLAIASRDTNNNFYSYNVGDASPTVDDASADITLTYAAAHDMVLSGVAYR
ncbi:MAG: sialate O-acetylesterase [Pseudomonadota bacterium]